MSLAGVQSKLGVRLLDNSQLAIPINGSASTHILKPDSPSLVGSVQNEAYCLTLARLCELATSDVTTGIAVNRRYLLLRRYDRSFMSGRWRRLHQEDFCQALGKPPEAKYERNQTGIRGPTALDMMLLAKRAAGGIGVLTMLDYIAFNIAVCNTDAHAKNYSLLITSRGFEVAPIYDVVSTQVWDGITLNLAQSISGQTRGDHIERRHWEDLADGAGLNATSAIRRIENLFDRVESKIAEARTLVASMPAGDHLVLDSVERAVKNRITRLRTRLASTARVVRPQIETPLDNPRRIYSSALRAANNPKEFKKTVRNLSKDTNLKAHDVRAIALDVLGRKFSSRKSALDALAEADGPELRLLS